MEKSILEMKVLHEGYKEEFQFCEAHIFIEELKKKFKLDK